MGLRGGTGGVTVFWARRVEEGGGGVEGGEEQRRVKGRLNAILNVITFL